MLTTNQTIWLSERGYYRFMYRSETTTTSDIQIQATSLQGHRRVVNCEGYMPALISKEDAVRIGSPYRLVWCKNDS